MNPRLKNFNTFEKFCDVGIKNITHNHETLKSGPYGLCLRVFLCSLFANKKRAIITTSE